jgi:hypothetical protein
VHTDEVHRGHPIENDEGSFHRWAHHELGKD